MSTRAISQPTHTLTRFLALDLFYAMKMEESIPVDPKRFYGLIYMMDKQPLLDGLDVNYAIWFISLNLYGVVQVFLNEYDKYQAALHGSPGVRYHIYPSHVQHDMVNQEAFYEYVFWRREHIHLFVHTVVHTGEQYLNEKSRTDEKLTVRLERILQLIDVRRPVLLTFPKQDYALAQIDKYVTSSRVFILVRCIMGPNSDRAENIPLQDIQKIDPSIKNAVYVIGFVEALGPEKCYSDEQLKAAEETLNDPKLKDLDVGILFALDIFCNYYALQKLAQRKNWKYSFIYLLQHDFAYNGDPYAGEVKFYLSFNGRFTYLNVNDQVREELYNAPNVYPTPSPTTPSVATTLATTPAPETTTTMNPTPEETTPPGTTTTTGTTFTTTEGLVNLGNQSLVSPEIPKTTYMGINQSYVRFPSLYGSATVNCFSWGSRFVVLILVMVMVKIDPIHW